MIGARPLSPDNGGLTSPLTKKGADMSAEKFFKENAERFTATSNQLEYNQQRGLLAMALQLSRVELSLIHI